MDVDICALDATEIAMRIRSGAMNSKQVVQSHLHRVATLNHKLNAVITLMSDEALESARIADERQKAGAPVGRLHGVPFSVKDSIDVAGVPSSRGSRLFADVVAKRDASVVSRLKSEGAIPLFKSNLPEFSMSYETTNDLVGPSRNPWNLDRTSGGSSGGESAAIAAGLSPLGVGSDVAISIRGPAALTGICGLKPTRARVPTTGHWPPVPATFWHVGPIARSIRDLELTLSIMEGPDGVDPHVRAAKRLATNRRAIRVGWCCEPEFAPVAQSVSAATDAAAIELEHRGFSVRRLELPFLKSATYDGTASILINAEILPFLRTVTAGHESVLSRTGKARLQRSLPSAKELERARSIVVQLKQSIDNLFEQIDVLLCPTLPMTAPHIGLDEYEISGVMVPATHIMDATVFSNLVGLPSLSVPFGVDSEGLPIAVQFIGRAFEDELVMRIGKIIESAALRPMMALKP